MTAYPPPFPPQDSTPLGANQPYGQPQPGPFQPGYPAGLVPSTPNERSMAMIAHLSMIIASLLSMGTLVILGPFIMWLIYKDKSPFVRQASAGAFNFAIWTAIAGIVSWLLIASIVGAFVGIPLLVLTGIVTIVFPILGAVRANRGEIYRYPLTPTILR